MVIIGRIILLGLFVLAVYLPLRGWKNWRGAWRYLALLPALPLIGLAGYLLSFIFTHEASEALSPELAMLVILFSVVFSALLGIFYNRSQKNK